MGERFGENLRAERLERGLTERELGEDPYSPSFISLLEAGRREPTSEVIAGLARRLGLASKAAEPWSQPNGANDGEYVLASLQACQAWDLHDFARAAGHAATAAQFALGGRDENAWWNMTYMQAECLMKQGQLTECQSIAENLLEHRVIAESDVLAIRAHRLLAAVCLKLGQLGTTVEHAREVIRLGAQMPPGSIVYIGAVRALIGALAESGRLNEAWEYCRVLGTHVDESMGQISGEVEWVIGNVAFMRADYEEGLKHHERAAKLLSSANDMELWARFNKATASVRLSGGIIEPETLAAIERADLALSIARGSRPERLEVAFLRARWLYLNDEIPAAIERLKEIHAEKDVLGRHTAGEVALLYGRALKALGRNDEALELLKDACVQFSYAGAADKVQQSIGEISAIHLAEQSPKAARTSPPARTD